MNSSKQNRAFSLLELIIVISLLGIVFGIIGTTFINSVKSVRNVEDEIQNQINNISLYNQLAKQLFAKYEKKKLNIIIQRDRISFYTYYPVFFEGAVRAEYVFEKLGEEKIKVVYQEAPYVDGKLGIEGVKKQTIGIYKNVSVDILQGNNWLENYKGKRFPKVLRLSLNDSIYYITVRRR